MEHKKNVQTLAKACGKIILCGEYAVLFGYPGIALPAPLYVTATFMENPNAGDIILEWEADEEWTEYVEEIINYCIALGSVPPGRLTIENTIPLNKGMGSSTAFVIAIAKCLLGENCKEEALYIENAVNPGHSGIDFAVIWNEKPLKFVKDKEPEIISLPNDLLNNAILIDTGNPDQQTPELVEDIRSREQELQEPLKTIAECSKKLQHSEDITDIFHEHHLAQVALGVVSSKAKNLITKIEQEGGAAKVIGAGGATGGSGMVLAVNVHADSISNEFPTLSL